MTNELKAGRELDALVAEKVMGCRVSWWSLRLVDRPPTDIEWRHGLFTSEASLERMEEGEVLVADANGDMPMHQMLGRSEWEGIPRYSTDIAAAWEVVEKMRARGLIVDLTLGAGAYCRIGGFRPFAEERGATAPLAICLAALKAVQS